MGRERRCSICPVWQETKVRLSAVARTGESRFIGVVGGGEWELVNPLIRGGGQALVVEGELQIQEVKLQAGRERLLTSFPATVR